MRIAIFGAGVTTPLVVGSLLRHAVDLGIEAVLIHDRDPVRLRAIGPLLELRTARHGRSVRLTADLSEVRGYRPDACIMSIRPGLDRGRSADERRAKEFGQLANETVGAAGMAFACRAVPATIGLLGSVLGDRPDCLVVNFTNPAGIVTQALRSAGFGNTFGVCSSAEKSARQLAAGSPADPRPWRPLVYGLNHCSWIYSARRDGVERLPQVLASDELLRTAQPWFDPDLPRRHGVLLNEYLHYYLQYPRAMEEQRRSPHTRGEFVESLNRDVHAALLAAETPAGLQPLPVAAEALVREAGRRQLPARGATRIQRRRWLLRSRAGCHLGSAAGAPGQPGLHPPGPGRGCSGAGRRGVDRLLHQWCARAGARPGRAAGTVRTPATGRAL